MHRAAARGWPLALLAASIAGHLIARHAIHASSIDLAIYRAEGQSVLAHVDLYSHLATPQDLQATYPPFAALVFVPLSWLPGGVVAAAGVVANLLVLLIAAELANRLATGGPRPGWRAAVVVGALTLCSEPVFTTLRNGQINLVLLVLVLGDFTVLSGSRWQGIGTGLAAGLKVTPAIFIVYLAVTRRTRAAATALATLALTIAVSAVLLPHATREYWTQLLFDATRVGRVEDEGNQSLLGCLVRLAGSTTQTGIEHVLVAAVVVGGLACAAVAHRRLGDRWGLLACAVTGLLAAPISWSHHWVWIVPIAVVLWRECRWGLLPAVAVFWSYLVWTVPHDDVGVELTLTPAQVALSTSYAAFGIAFLAYTGWRAATQPRTSGMMEPWQATAGRTSGSLRAASPSNASSEKPWR